MMALLILSPEISSLARGGTHVRTIPRICSRRVKFVACWGMKGLENEVLKLRSDNYRDGLRWLYGQVKQSETAPFSSRRDEEEERKKREYYVNTGYAIRTLREEFPELFYRELSFDIYREDIVFKDPINAISGLENYKSIFWALRFHGRIFFRALWVDIISVWQPVESMILVRWAVHGVPRIPWESRSRFDGTSEYKLDKDGKIYEHKVHNIALNGPQKFLVMDQLIQSIGCPSTPKPTYFELMSSPTGCMSQQFNILESVQTLHGSEVESQSQQST